MINIFALRPLSVLEQFDELRRALSSLHGRNVEFEVDVAAILRRAMSRLLKWHVDSATAATWVPRASDGPAAARAFAWRVLRLMPLSEQLLALLPSPRTSP